MIQDSKLGQINAPLVLLVPDLAELLLRDPLHPQRSFEGKRRRTGGEKRCFPCACPDQDLIWFLEKEIIKKHVFGDAVA